MSADLIDRLRGVMRRMPAPVALVTARDPATGLPCGLVVSALIPVSMEPPSMLVSVNRSASAHGAIATSCRFCINLIGPHHAELIDIFADPARRDQRFASVDWRLDADLPFLLNAAAAISCEKRHSFSWGTHDLFVGNVVEILTAGNEPSLGWVEGAAASLRREQPTAAAPVRIAKEVRPE